MTLNTILQSGVAKPHLLCLVSLLIVARLLRGRRGAFEVWLIASVTAAVVAIGLAGFLLLLLAASFGRDVFIAPIAFAGGFFVAFLTYAAVFIVSFLSRPPPAPHRSWMLALLGFSAFNAIFLTLPTTAGTTITLRIFSPEGQPVKNAAFSYETEFAEAPLSLMSDDSGHIVLRSKLGDTIDGEFAPFASYAGAKVYISAPKRGGERWGIQRRWTTSFASQDFLAYGFFLSDFDDLSNHSVDVYLPWRDRPQLLPYRGLARLADRLKEAQKTGQMFNSELNVQNLESYVQLSEVAQTYDPKSPVRYYALNIFSYLTEEHDGLEKLLQKIADENTPPQLREIVLSQLLSLFSISSSSALTWQEKRNLVQQRLDRDLAILKNVPKPT